MTSTSTRGVTLPTAAPKAGLGKINTGEKEIEREIKKLRKRGRLRETEIKRDRDILRETIERV